MSISGCNTDSEVSEVLNVAEDRMDAAPDSVLRLIDTLDIDRIGGKALAVRPMRQRVSIMLLSRVKNKLGEKCHV